MISFLWEKILECDDALCALARKFKITKMEQKESNQDEIITPFSLQKYHRTILIPRNAGASRLIQKQKKWKSLEFGTFWF